MAIPDVVLPLCPEVTGQEGSLVGAQKVVEVEPLGQDQIRLEGAAVIHEDLVIARFFPVVLAPGGL